MPTIQCPIPDCGYNTGEVEAAIAAALLLVHNNTHVAAPAPRANKQKPPKIDRPKISKRSPEETWRAFTTRWNMFKEGTDINIQETKNQLFQCCDEDLGDDILKGHPNIIESSEVDMLDKIKKLAVIPVAVSVRRSEKIFGHTMLG